MLFRSHWHEEMEISYVESGEAEYQIGLEIFTVKAGDIVLVNPHQLHRLSRSRDIDMVSHRFVFHVNLLRNSSLDTCAVQFFHPIGSAVCRE